MQKILASMVIEILGRPKEYMVESMEKLLENLAKEKGVEVIKKKIHEAVKVENSEDFFTTFAELEIKFDSLSNYFGIMFAYMPSNVELIEPEKITLANQDLTEVANILVQRLHNYDGLVKKLVGDQQLLLQKIKEISPEEYEKFAVKQFKQQPEI